MISRKANLVSNDLVNIRSGLNRIYNGKKLIFGGDVSGNHYTIVDVELSAGTYHLSIDNIISDDTDSDKCIVLFRNSAPLTSILILTLDRGVAISVDIVLVAQADQICFYASNTSANAVNDAFTYSNVELTQALTDTTLTVSGGYADAKATGDAIKDFVFTDPNALYLYNSDVLMPINGFLKIDGSITLNNSGYWVSNYLPIKSGQTVRYGLRAPATTAVLCFYSAPNISGFVSPPVAGTNSFEEGTFTAPNDGYIRISTTNATKATSYCYIPIEFNKNIYTPKEKGLNVLLLGDSIFGNDGEIALYMAHECASCVNGAFGGTRVSVRDNGDFKYFDGVNLITALTTQTWTDQDTASTALSANYPWIPSRLAGLKAVDMSKVNVIIMDWGTNDYTASQTIETIITAYNTVIDMLQRTYPTIRLLITTPIWRYWGTEIDNENGDTKIYNISTLKDIALAIEQNAKDKKISVFNAYQNIPLSYATASAFYDAGDTTHLNNAGNKVYAGYLLGKLKTMY